MRTAQIVIALAVSVPIVGIGYSSDSDAALLRCNMQPLPIRNLEGGDPGTRLMEIPIRHGPLPGARVRRAVSIPELMRKPLCGRQRTT